jgi:hypothetical protein
MRRSQTQKNVIRVSEEFQIPGTNLVLEEGDTIERIQESVFPDNEKVRRLIYEVGIDEILGSLINDMQENPDSDLSAFVKSLKTTYYTLQKSKISMGDRYFT